MNTHIFLGGGGDAQDSRLLDEQFVEQCLGDKMLVYVPNAMQLARHPSCLEWFTGVMKPLNVKKITMCTDLKSPPEVSGVGGVYIGGGDARKLLREVMEAGFDGYLRQLLAMGGGLYGGSAGAILFGKDIRTASEARQVAPREACGLDIVGGYSIVCHYTRRKQNTTQELVGKVATPIIAIPEKSGAYISHARLKNYGTQDILIFRESSIEPIAPGQTQKLL